MRRYATDLGLALLVAAAVPAVWAWRHRPEAASPPRRAAALADPHHRPDPVRTYPLPGYAMETGLRRAVLNKVAWYTWVKGFTAGQVHALRLLNLARATDGLQEADYYEVCRRRLLDGRTARKDKAILPLLVDTVYGAGYRTRDRGPDSGGGDFLGGMTHVDKMLSVLGELGVPLDERVITDSGTSYPLAAVLEDSLQRYRPDREMEWSFLAYCDYLGGQRRWTNDRGETYDLDGLMRRLLAQKPLDGPCLGGHRVYDLVKAVAAERRSPGRFDPATVRRAEEAVRATREALAVSQRPDGAWDRSWPGPLAPEVRPAQGADAEAIDTLTATGHMLEWFAIAPPDLRPPDPVIRRAVDYLERRLTATDDDDFCFNRGLLPATHAVRALLHLSDHDSGRSGREATR